MTDRQELGGPPAPKTSPTAQRPLRPSVTRFVLGWLVVPALVVAALVLAGVHLGARNPDAWYTNFVRWLLSLG